MANHPVASSGGTMLLKDKRIFIVEDNTLNRIVYQMSLVVQGAQVEFERAGPDTLYRLKFFRDVDLIILDLMLARGSSGFDVFTRLREQPQYAQVPIVAVSAADPMTALPKAKTMGFSGYIAKPIDDNLFPRQLLQIMNGEPVWYAGERYFSGGA